MALKINKDEFGLKGICAVRILNMKWVQKESYIVVLSVGFLLAKAQCLIIVEDLRAAYVLHGH